MMSDGVGCRDMARDPQQARSVRACYGIAGHFTLKLADGDALLGVAWMQ